MLRTTRTAGAVAGLLAAGLLLGGCGEEQSGQAEDPATSGSSATSDLPDCAEVWTAGSTLPADYRGCFDGETEVPTDRVECSSGQFLVTFDDTFYAVEGGPVNERPGGLAADKSYQKVRRSCFG